MLETGAARAPAPPVERLDVRAGGVRLCVELRGQGPPCLLLHGFAGSARALAPLADALALRHRVIAPDLVGHGRSAAPDDPGAYAWDAVAAQLLGVLDAAREPRPHVFGFSMGGRLALHLAARHPERVRSVFTLGARCGWPEHGTARSARRRSDAELAVRLLVEGFDALAGPRARAVAGDEEERYEAALGSIRQAAPDGGAHGLALALQALGAADQPDESAQLASAALPLCLAAGELDAGPLGSARALAGAVPGARAVAIAGAGHAAHLERPQEVVDLALGFFAEVDA